MSNNDFKLSSIPERVEKIEKILGIQEGVKEAPKINATQPKQSEEFPNERQRDRMHALEPKLKRIIKILIEMEKKGRTITQKELFREYNKNPLQNKEISETRLSVDYLESLKRYNFVNYTEGKPKYVYLSEEFKNLI